MAKKVRVVTVQFAVDEERNINEVTDQLNQMTKDYIDGMRLKRYSVQGPVDEDHFFQLGLF